MNDTTQGFGGRRVRRILVALAAFAVLAAACGDDDDTATDATTTTGATETTGAIDTSALDANGDGEVRIGIAAAGPRDDGAYYQAVVDAAETISEENGFGEVIVVDNIQAADAATELENLAQQPIDILVVGASEIAEPMPDLAKKYSDIFWYCNCGAGFPESPDYLQSTDNGAGIAYTAGVATGILLRDSGGDAITMVGCCDLGFEIQHYLAFQEGLAAVDPALEFTYVESGDFPFDFDNVQNATAAYETAVAEGADAIYPYLGGAHEPLVKLANDGGQIVLSAGASDVCTREGDLKWDIAVRFDGGDYVRAIFPQILTGEATEGQTITFSPGDASNLNGALLCDGTDEQNAELEEAYALVESGDLDAKFGEIAAEAFGGG
jgi:basic membrane protein A